MASSVASFSLSSSHRSSSISFRRAMYILKCEAFDNEVSSRHANKCCVGDCHDSGGLIPVVPHALDATLENRRLDWEMGIQAMVCCGRYEFVRSLSREWWAKRGQEVGLWTEDTARKLMHQGSYHRTFERRSVSGSGYGSEGSRNVSPRGNMGSSKVSGKGKCPGCGGKWSGDVCENCGYGMSI